MAFKFDVVISGISGRFPECDDIDTFKTKLYKGDSNEFVTSNDKKWTRGFKFNRFGDKVVVPDATGKYTKDIEFDYRLFKFNLLFGRSTDVVNRKILEPSFEAIIDAGINPYSLDGANIGVFMTGGIPEREINLYDTINNNKEHVFILGNARTMGPNRLSYTLNLTGPSYAIHTDPLGGFAALKVAKDMIADGSIEGAVVAVASNITNPRFSYLFMYLDLLTSDECCRPFDKNANGYVRSESAVVFFLQREQDAKRQYAKLLLCDNCFDGLSSHTLLGYDEEYLKNILRNIYEKNSDTTLVETIDFVELTGCAVKRFESMEANAVADVLCSRRTTPLMIGSVKSSVGHTEASAGFLSILKTLIAMNSEMIPPNSNFTEINKDIRAFQENRMKVVEKATEFCGNITAVNTIGLWGTVNHVVLQNNCRKSKNNSDNIPRLLLLSGRTPDGLDRVLKKIESDPFNVNAIALANEVFQKNMPFHIYRGFTILPKAEISTAVYGECNNPKRPICFIFSGMGSQWNGMGNQLLDFPIIADVIKRCDAVLKPKSIDIYKVLLSEDPAIFDDITNSFVAIICLQIALVEVLKKLNIVPDLILGHSVGENGCAYSDGCLTLEQAVLVSYARGFASTSAKTIKGMMAAVGKGYREIKDDLPKNIEVACHNAVNSCTLSGPADDIEAYTEKLKNEGIFAKSVNVANIAYHSQYIAPAAPKLLELLKEVIPEPKKRSSKWISSSVPESEWHLPIADVCSAEYLTNNLLKPVLFEEACGHIPKDAVCIEIAPHGLLQAILKRSLPETCSNISLTLRSTKKENLNFLLSSIGKLYVAGCEPEVNNLYPPIEYPVPRGTPSISPYCTWFHGDIDVVTPPSVPPRPSALSRENIIVRMSGDAEFNYLKYHQINEKTIIPPSFYFYLVWRMLAVQQKVKMDDFPVQFENIKIHKNVEISISKPRVVNIMIQGSGSFEVLSRAKSSKKESKVIVTGRIEFVRDDLKTPSIDFDSAGSKLTIEADEINTILKNAGFHLGECFQLLKLVKMKDSQLEGNIEWNGNWVTFLDSIMKFQMFSDPRKSKLCFLNSIRRMIINPSAENSQTLGSQVVANYCQLTKYCKCNGIDIADAKWRIDDQKTASKSYSSSRIRKMRFVSYNNPSCQSREEFVDLCVQISLDALKTMDTVSNFYICDSTGKFIKNIQRSEILKDTIEEKIIFSDCIENISLKKLSENDSYFLIAEEKISDIEVLSLENVFVLLIVPKVDADISIDFTTILMQSFDEKVFVLLKKKLNYTPAIRVEEKNTNDYRATNGISNAANEIIVRPGLDSSALTLLFSRKKRSSSRNVFVVGNNTLSPENEPAFMSKLLTVLPNTVIKNQDWGSYRYVTSNSVNDDCGSIKMKNSLMDTEIELINVKCISCDDSEALSGNKPPVSDEIELLGIEYSGWNVAGKKVMGLTFTSPTQLISNVDPLLTWLVPDEWTLSEAVTVPAVYAHVYSAMEIIEGFFYSPNQSILIITDGENIFAESLISLLIVKKLTTYIVVPDEQNAKDLKLKFPSLSDSSVIINTNNDFDIIILTKTKGKGVNILINFSTDFRNLTSLMNCNSLNSHIIETVDSYANEDNELGLYPFVRNCSFNLLPCRITHFLNLQNDQKSRLQKAIKEGIASGFVKPVPRRPGMLSVEKLRDWRIDDSYDKCNSISQIQLNTDFKFSCDSMKFMTNRSYVIIVGERGADACMKIIQWLSERGALSIVVVVEKFFSTSRISSQINRLLGNKKITLSFRSLNKLNSTDDAVQLIDEINKVAPLDSVFFVSMESASRMINYMDNATKMCKENIKFISFFAGGIEEMEARQRRGQPSFVLHGDRFPKNISEVLIDFEKILKIQKSFDNQHILYEIIENSNTSDGSNELSSLRSFLPKSIHNLEEIGRNMASEEVKFVEMTSRCAKWAECRGVYPIFVIPSLHAFELQQLFQSLMYPVFCASLTEKSSSVHEVASKLYQHLNLIQKAGPVTLIGETWNAAVAIELSSLIKKSGRDFKLFVLEGNPIEWRNTINTLNVTESQGFEKALTKIYGDKILEYLHSWNSAETKNFNHHPTNEIPSGNHINFTHVCRCLRVLKQQFINALKHDLKNSMLENTIFFSGRVSKDISLVLSDSSDMIWVQENNYDSFTSSPVIVKTVNKHAMFAW